MSSEDAEDLSDDVSLGGIVETMLSHTLSLPTTS